MSKKAQSREGFTNNAKMSHSASFLGRLEDPYLLNIIIIIGRDRDAADSYLDFRSER